MFVNHLFLAEHDTDIYQWQHMSFLYKKNKTLSLAWFGNHINIFTCMNIINLSKAIEQLIVSTLESAIFFLYLSPSLLQSVEQEKRPLLGALEFKPERWNCLPEKSQGVYEAAADIYWLSNQFDFFVTKICLGLNKELSCFHLSTLPELYPIYFS